MHYPRKCPECGEEVKPLPDKEVNLLIPTCTECGEEFIDEETAEALDKADRDKSLLESLGELLDEAGLIIPYKYQAYMNLIRDIELIMVTSSEEWNCRDISKLKTTLKTFEHAGLITKSEVTRGVIKVAMTHSLEYIEKHPGPTPWIVRTPFEVLAKLEVKSDRH